MKGSLMNRKHLLFLVSILMLCLTVVSGASAQEAGVDVTREGEDPNALFGFQPHELLLAFNMNAGSLEMAVTNSWDCTALPKDTKTMARSEALALITSCFFPPQPADGSIIQPGMHFAAGQIGSGSALQVQITNTGTETITCAVTTDLTAAGDMLWNIASGATVTAPTTYDPAVNSFVWILCGPADFQSGLPPVQYFFTPA
jgi:hypothetical protein